MILLFVGAGGSAAIDKRKFPTTDGFFSRLPKSVTGSMWYDQIHGFLTHTIGPKIDIEHMLWAIDDYLEEASMMKNDGRPLGWMMAGNRIHSMLSKSRVDYTIVINEISSFIPGLIKIKNSIYEEIHKVYGAREDESFYKDNRWSRFIQGLIANRRVEIFTTNYDTILERTINVNDLDIEYGRNQQGIAFTLNEDHWTKDNPSGKSGLLTKLHGSIDWKHYNGRIEFSNIQNQPFDSTNNVILYPGFKDQLLESPFDTFYGHLGGVARQAHAIIFVGFSFRDPQINTVLTDNFREGTHVFVIDQRKDETDVTALISQMPNMVREHVVVLDFCKRQNSWDNRSRIEGSANSMELGIFGRTKASPAFVSPGHERGCSCQVLLIFPRWLKKRWQSSAASSPTPRSAVTLPSI